MQDLRIALVQTDLIWEDPSGNVANFRKWMEKIPEGTRLVVLPETFSTGFSNRPEVCADEMTGEAVMFMMEMAETKDLIVTGSLLIREEGKFYNRCICAFPDGRLSWYDKKHLFRMSDEYRVFTSGLGKLIINSASWKIQPMVCYDLRFPVWVRNTFVNETFAYDLLVFVANWPESRNNVWKSLLVARAIENQAYVVGVNRTGTDGEGTSYAGNSMVVDPKGKILLDASSDEGVFDITLRLEDLEQFRRSFPVAYDWDRFRIEM